MTNEELTMSNEEAKEILINEIQQWKANPDLVVGEPLYIAIYTAIKALESQRWIPITEKPPEFHQDILLSLRSLDVTDGFRSGTEPYFYCHGEYIEPQNVLAWMPLPQSYKEENNAK